MKSAMKTTFSVYYKNWKGDWTLFSQHRSETAAAQASKKAWRKAENGKVTIQKTFA